ncbi:MAG: hypothetical protein GYA17_09670, partial [Chloroflexi bacterium]|nr:hypothetical protein [Chloroflexota bacterium]
MNQPPTTSLPGTNPDQAAPTPLVIEDLSFRYRSRSAPAITGISLAVQPGELLLIAGASGCGKTTLA